MVSLLYLLSIVHHTLALPILVTSTLVTVMIPIVLDLSSPNMASYMECMHEKHGITPIMALVVYLKIAGK